MDWRRDVTSYSHVTQRLISAALSVKQQHPASTNRDHVADSLINVTITVPSTGPVPRRTYTGNR